MANSLFHFLPFEFASPLFLLGLAALAVIWKLLSVKKKPKQQYSDFRMLGKADGRSRKIFVWTLALVTAISLFGALARPYVRVEEIIPQYGRDFVAVFDFSGSMDDPFKREEGPQESKFDAGRDAIFSFIESRAEDRFGFVLFAASAYSMPILKGSRHILENPALKDGLEERRFTILDQLYSYGTEIDAGIFAAITVFEKMSSAETQIIILMTDLEDTSEGPIAAMREAKRAGVDKIYILHVAGSGFADATSRETKSAIEAEFPEFVKIFDIGDARGLEGAYREIDALERSKTSEQIIASRKSVTGYFIASALASFVLLGVYSFTAWRKIL